jgi:transcriptional regulator with XRE-family HTH domain
MSQRELAERCGISSPQIQKYEHGQNRISVARMLDLSQALNVVPEYFFNDLLESERPEADEDEMDIAQAVQAARVGRWWASITDPMTRIHIRELLRCLANQESLHGVIPHGGSPAVTRNKAKRKAV